MDEIILQLKAMPKRTHFGISCIDMLPGNSLMDFSIPLLTRPRVLIITGVDMAFIPHILSIAYYMSSYLESFSVALTESVLRWGLILQ